MFIKNSILFFTLLFTVSITPLYAKESGRLLQELDFSDIENLSTEGAEGKLFIINNNKENICKIEMQLFGEMGRSSFVFKFKKDLISGEETVINYKVPIYWDSNVKIASSVKKDLLNSSEEEKAAIIDIFEISKQQISKENLDFCGSV